MTTKLHFKTLAMAATAGVLHTAGYANQPLETVRIIGDADAISTIAGSAHVIDQEELQQFEYSDIHRMLGAVPGVYLQQEDGYGLRPNIGIRGSGSGRSSKVSLMEDGILIAPAPYSNPEAYYFPTAARMSGIEILKGPETLKHGPFTVGGAINLLSTPIPDRAMGEVNLEAGQDNELRAHLHYGDSNEQFGWLLEAHRQGADGYKSIDRSNRDAGIDKQDYMAKFRLSLPGSDTLQQQVEAKLQYSEELSNMSYVGLSDADLANDAERRYGLTELDQMNNRHAGLTLTHSLQLDETLSFSSTAYYQHFNRDWYKVDKIGGQSADKFFEEVNTGADILVGIDALAVLHGQEDINGIDIKHNNREYRSKGVDFKLNWAFNTAGLGHQLSAGARLHRDQMDRFQPVDVFNQVAGALSYASTKVATGSNNRLEVGRARSLYLFDRIEVNERLDVTATLHHEDIKTERDEFSDFGRETVPSHRQNHSEALLPGLGALYSLDDQWSVLAGVHKGFAPAGGGAKDGEDPEESWNYELGLRFNTATLSAEAIVFYSDYQNTVKNCSVAVPCSGGRDSGTETMGESLIQGLEASISYQFDLGAGLQLPVTASYTYTDAEYVEDADDGSVLNGDNMTYLPEQQLALRASLVADNGWNGSLNLRYNDEMCIDVKCERNGRNNHFYQTDSYWVLDASANYPINEALTTYIKIDNLLDEDAIASRSPHGARAEKPRSAYVGIRYQF